jgi:hypothetical protein
LILEIDFCELLQALRLRYKAGAQSLLRMSICVTLTSSVELGGGNDGRLAAVLGIVVVVVVVFVVVPLELEVDALVTETAADQQNIRGRARNAASVYYGVH